MINFFCNISMNMGSQSLLYGCEYVCMCVNCHHFTLLKVLCLEARDDSC